MPMAVKLSDEIVEVARKEAAVMKRSIAGQVEYWAALGSAIEATGLLDYTRVRAVLSGKGSVQDLQPLETNLYLRLLGHDLESLDGSDTRRVRRLESEGHPIAGDDRRGKLVVRRRRSSRARE